jgi:inosine/xanthosine triphosphatase
MADVIRLCVGSTNPVKVNAAKQAFAAVFPECVIDCKSMKAPSGVAEQPMTQAETRLGAQNRVRYCAGSVDANTFDYCVAMEGGVDQFEEGAASFSYVAVLNLNKEKGKGGDLFTGRSANLPLPDKIFKRLQQGEELGPVMDEVFNTSNIKQKGGAIGLLTNHAATREGVYTQALILALAPALQPDHY